MLEYFPDPYPDELLYSVWARLSDLVHYSNRELVTQALFGKRSYNALVDWSCSLDYLVNQLPRGHCYTVDMLIENHTLFPYYAPFLPTDRRDHIYQQMRSGNGRALSARLGLLTSHIPSYRWLRYCPECVKSDRERFGETYWHRLHQAPGVAVCPMHATWLSESTVARPPGKDMYLSAERTALGVAPRFAGDAPLYGFLKEIAECIEHLLRFASASPGLPFLRKQYLALLSHRDLVTINGVVRIVELLQALTAHFPPSLLAWLHCELGGATKVERSWPIRLLRTDRIQHPLHHVLVLLFLGSPIETVLRFPITPSSPFGKGPWPCLNLICEHYHTFCIEEYSLRENLEKNRPAGLFACPFCGFTYSRVGPDSSPEDMFRRDRIPAYGQVWERRLQDLWGDPALDLTGIARHLGVSSPTVKRLAKMLMLPPRLRSQKKKVQKERKDLEQRRNEWVRLVEAHGGEDLTDLRRNIPGAQVLYNWLNKYDREWLCAHFPQKKPRRVKEALRTLSQTTDEDALKNQKEDRDVLTAHSIKRIAQQMKNAPGEPRRVTQAQLRRAIPSLGWLLSSPQRYSLTVQAFQDALETWEAFALRRIEWALKKCQEEALRPTRNKFRLMIQASAAWDIPSVQVTFEAALSALDEMTCEPQTLPQVSDADFILSSGVYS